MKNLVPSATGAYSFLPGIRPYSGGVVAAPGYQIVRAVLPKPVRIQEGFERIREHLRSLDLPQQRLCAIELRCPRPYSFAGFDDFNEEYGRILDDWELPVNGLNPIARTNVAPAHGAVAEPCLYAFAYAAPGEGRSKTFVVSGGGELPEQVLDPAAIVRARELSAEALSEKARFVMGLMQGRLEALEAGWSDTTSVNIYTVHDIHPFLQSRILAEIEPAHPHGIRWHYAQPPITDVAFEMDVRGVRSELYLEN